MNMNPQQYEAATCINGYVCVLAAAGSGKTSTLINRVGYLVQIGIRPESILALTFTNRAADEMKIRASKAFDERCAHITACTFHSFCANMLRRYASFANLATDFNILQQSDVKDIIKQTRVELGYQGRDFPKDSLTASLFSAIVNRKKSIDELVETKEYKKCRKFCNELSEIHQEYLTYKEKRNLLDFDDLLVIFLNALKKYPYVLEHISDTYQYIMVDEYQDTNIIQEEIGLLIAKKYGNMMVVGDYGQSLYAFRGADVRNILDFPKKVPNCRVINLFENYRSPSEVVAVGNDIIAQSTETDPLPMHAQFSTQRKPILRIVPTQKDEADYILHIIQNVPPEDVAILYRSSRSASILEPALIRANIPYKKYGGLKFFEKEHIRDMLAHLRVMTNEKDKISWFRVLSLHDGIGDAYANKLSALCEDMGNEALLRNPYTKRKFYKELKNMYKFFTRTKGNVDEIVKSVAEYYDNIRKETIRNMATDEHTRAEKFHAHQMAMEDIGILIDAAKDYKSVASYIDDFTLDNKRPDDDTPSLTLSTIHSAKGLEWKYVVIMDCVDGIFPSTTEVGTKEDNEELRCMYVAVTRAKQDLVMIAPQRIADYTGQYTSVDLSHFLTGISSYRKSM